MYLKILPSELFKYITDAFFILKKHWWFALLAILIFTLKLAISTLGYNTDIEIWKYVTDELVENFLNGRVVYTYTHFYNHGPIREYALFLLGTFLSKMALTNIYTLHFVVVIFLSLSDTLIAILLWKMFGKAPAVIFLLNPVSILITGYHSQIGTVAIMTALFSWKYFLTAVKKEEKYRKHLIKSAILLGISLSIKHIFLFLPIFILIAYKKYKFLKLKELVLYIFLVYSIFFGFFIIEILRDRYHPILETAKAVKEHVFEYRSWDIYGKSGFTQLVKLVIPEYYINKYLTKIPIIGGYTFIFIAALATYGHFVIKKLELDQLKFLFPFYLLALFIFSPSLADQYLAMPLLAMAIFYENFFVLGFFIVTYMYLANGFSANIAGLAPYSLILRFGNTNIGFWPWQSTTFKASFTQIWGLLVGITLLLQLYLSKVKTLKSKTLKLNKVTKIYATIFGIIAILLTYFVFAFHNQTSDIKIIQAKKFTLCNRKIDEKNITKQAKKVCEGKEQCQLALQQKEKCETVVKAEWSCMNKPIIDVINSKTDSLNENNNTRITCPGLIFRPRNYFKAY